MARYSPLDDQIAYKKISVLNNSHKYIIDEIYSYKPYFYTISDKFGVTDDVLKCCLSELLQWNIILKVRRVPHPLLTFVDAVGDNLFLRLTGIGEVIAERLAK